MLDRSEQQRDCILALRSPTFAETLHSQANISIWSFSIRFHKKLADGTPFTRGICFLIQKISKSWMNNPKKWMFNSWITVTGRSWHDRDIPPFPCLSVLMQVTAYSASSFQQATCSAVLQLLWVLIPQDMVLKLELKSESPRGLA